MKIYIQQFDPQKIYLLEQEAIPFLVLGNERAEEIAKKMSAGNFEDFYAMDAVMEKAIARSRRLRMKIFQKFSEKKLYTFSPFEISPSYSESEKELQKRLQKKLVNFYLYHRSEDPSWNPKKTEKLCTLFEKQLQRQEKGYLARNPNSQSMKPEEKEHTISLRILKAFAKSLDAHSAFFSEEEAKQMRLTLEKEFEGYGIVMAEGLEGVYISSVIKGSPAEKSGGIKPKDLVTHINGKSTQNLSFEEILALMKKGKKKRVILGIKNSTGERQVTLTKAPIVMEGERLQYSYEPYGNGIIGKITLHSFYENGNGITAEKDLRAAIHKMEQIKPLKGLVLDLRENSGGFLSQAVKVSSLFISSGVVVVSKYGKQEKHYLRTIDKKPSYNGPLIILTSKMSASAAEIVAQALQDYGSALVVGDERTFGKGSIQYQTVTDAKAKYFFKVTVGRYYTVSGRSTQITGVIPDIQIPTHYAPFTIGEKYLEYPLPADRISPIYQDNLSDLNSKARRWFEKNYLPFLQKKVHFWKKMVPQLAENSRLRINNNPRFQQYLRTQKKIKEQISKKEPLMANPMNNYGFEDLQLEEAVYILKDMILFEAKSRISAGLKYTERGQDPLSYFPKAS